MIERSSAASVGSGHRREGIRAPGGWGLAGTFLIAALTATPAWGETSWPSFRNGGTSITEVSRVPTEWSPDEGIAWRAAIPGYGQSSPVVWNDLVFLTSSDGPFQERCYVHAFDLQTGAKAWTTEIRGSTKVENYFRNSRAAPTSAVDADRVISFFASGDVTAMDHEGQILWTVPLFKRFGAVNNERGTASSLAQTEDRVYLVIDHDGPSYIIAIDKRDGTIVWKTDRGQRVPSWSSPVVTRQAGRDVVVVSSADTVDAYDAANGRELWHVPNLQGNHIPSATVVDGSVFVGSTEMYHGAFDAEAVAGSNCRIDLTTTGSEPAYKIRWGAQRANSYYSSPLAFAGYVYYVNKAGILYCVDQETGEQLYAKRVGSPCWASAIGVNCQGESLAYFVLKNGFTLVLRPADRFEVVARNQLWDYDQMREAAELAATKRKENAVPADQAAPKEGPEKIFAGMPEQALHQMFSYGDPTAYAAVIVEGNLLVRTGQHLYCIRRDHQ